VAAGGIELQRLVTYGNIQGAIGVGGQRLGPNGGVAVCCLAGLKGLPADRNVVLSGGVVL